jgi:hypothetical protein
VQIWDKVSSIRIELAIVGIAIVDLHYENDHLLEVVGFLNN